MHPRTILARSTKRDSIVLLRDHASKVFLSSSEQRGIFALLDIGAPFVQEYINYRVLMQLSTSFWRETKDPEGVKQDSPGREPWVQGPDCESPERAAQGVRSQLQINARHKARLWYRDPPHRPFGASVVTVLVPRACALGFPESPLRG